MAKKTIGIKNKTNIISFDYKQFDELIAIVERARARLHRAANREFITMYWDVGAYISKKLESAEWGNATVNTFSKFINTKYPGIIGFSPQNIWRMRQLYDYYKGNEKLSPLVREISWTNNMVVLARAKTDEAKEFYLRLCTNNNYSKRELERQIDSMMFERTMVSDVKNKDFLARSEGLQSLRDSYILEFMNLPVEYKENDLRKAIIGNLKQFILEFGKDFALMGEEYRVQVGKSDFKIDLLFYNRTLQCMVAVELKTGKFKPEHVGQLEFYLEALDSDVKKNHENPSVGLVLCADKDDAVVEYALRRSISPALIAEYQLCLPDKKVLQDKLSEIKIMTESTSSDV